jgi:hypothetical protein
MIDERVASVMSPRPEEYLVIAMARHAELIYETQWERLLRGTRKPSAPRTRVARNYFAARLRWLADRLQAEPDLLATAG